MRGNKLDVNRTKREKQHDTTFVKGGKTKMFRQQAAGPKQAGITGKRETPAPGARFARGGGEKVFSGGFAKPAQGGATGPR
jgi:hypothetical protein